MTTLDDLSRDDLIKVMNRDRFVKEQLAGRIAALTTENVELYGIVHEMETELAAARDEISKLNSPTLTGE